MKKLFVLKHVEHEGPSLFLEISKEFGLEDEIINLYLGDNLPVVSNDDCVLSMGGPMGISDLPRIGYEFLNDEILFIDKLIKNKRKFIGVCLGAQLLAYACGGSVKKLKDRDDISYRAEIGWSPIYVFKSPPPDEFNRSLNQPLQVLHWHSDQIILPNNSKLIASSSRCPEQIFQIKDNVYGIQCHVEVNESDVMNWINKDYDFIISNIGKEGLQNLKDDNKLFCKSSEETRKQFIRDIFTNLYK